MYPSRTTRTITQRQDGAAMMIMLVIMIIGTAAFLVSTLTNTALKIASDAQTTDALSQARDALIGYAASDSVRPGELPCPDFDNDGMITPNDYSGSNNCKSLIGWLPWKTLGLPELRDANGNHLWYAVSSPFHANGSAPLNSDTPINPAYASSMLTVIDGVTAATLENNVIAILFAPGVPIINQTRSPSDNNAINSTPNYLEGDNANFDTRYQTANNMVTPSPSTIINDRLLTITYASLFPSVERRIARDVKNCLDAYAASSVNNTYPWPASITDTTYYPNRFGQTANLLGRIPEVINTGSPPPSGTLLADLQNVQTAMNAYNNQTGSLSALNSAGDALKDYAYSIGLSNTNPAVQAGILADNCTGTSCIASLTFQLNSALGQWPTPSCSALFTSPSSYWQNWRDLVFYQIASGYQPGGSASPGLSPFPVTINNVGSYRAAVTIARQFLPSPYNTTRPYSPFTGTVDTAYLEGTNQHQTLPQTSPQTSPSTNFITYNPSDSLHYLQVNDLVLCIDGKGINPNSVCP